MNLSLTLVLCSIVTVGNVFCAKLLLVFPMWSYSHYNLGNRLMHVLAEKGHEVTYISPYRDALLPKSCREIYLEGLEKYGEEGKKDLVDYLFRSSYPEMIHFIANIGIKTTELTLSHPNVQKLLNDPNEKFDAVIIEQFHNNALRGFGHHFKAPLITFSTIGASSWTNSLMGNPEPWSYVPELFLPYNATMNFYQRLHNAFTGIFHMLDDYFYLIPQMNKLVKKHFLGAPPVEVLDHNVSLVLLNSHVSTNQPVPLLPNMIEIGGYHVNPPKKLPHDLQTYLDNSKNGAIYFSLGSNMKSRDLKIATRDAILRSFSKLKVNVLWKWEDDSLPGQPANVKLSKWLPQEDILAHPNVKAFITHGGLLSIIETIYHGVPVIGFPIFGDQKLNMANAVAGGYGIQLDLATVDERKFSVALNDILNNPHYTEHAKLRSKLMHDRQNTPRETAVYWIEYVIRHGGAPHFRSAALDLAWYQLCMLDVVVFIGISFGFLVLITRFTSKLLQNPQDGKKKLD